MPPLLNPQNAEFWILIAIVVFFAVLWRAKVPGTADVTDQRAMAAAVAKLPGQAGDRRRPHQQRRRQRAGRASVAGARRPNGGGRSR